MFLRQDTIAKKEFLLLVTWSRLRGDRIFSNIFLDLENNPRAIVSTIGEKKDTEELSDEVTRSASSILFLQSPSRSTGELRA